MSLDLKQKVNLYFNEFPLVCATTKVRAIMNKAVADKYLFVFVQNDTPVDIHHKTADRLRETYGSHSENPVTLEKGYANPFLINGETGQAITDYLRDGNGKEIPINANILKQTNWKVGGFSVAKPLADIIIAEFEKDNYEVIRKYK